MADVRAGARVRAVCGDYSWTWDDFLLVHREDPEGAARAAFNATIQAVPPRWTLRAAERAAKEGIDIRLQTHDGLLAYAPIREAWDQAKRLKQIMAEVSAETINGLPVPADVKVGPSWAELSKEENK